MRPSAIRALIPAVLAILGGLSASPPLRAAVSPEWAEKWREDLRFVAREMPLRHVDLFHTLDREEWEREISGLAGRVDGMEHHQIVVDLARIIARIGDGHTRLTLPLDPGIEFEQGHSSTPEPALPALVFHQLPVRFIVDGSGVWVSAVAAPYREILGGRVVRLGRLPIDEAVAAVSPTIRRDNEMQVLHHLPMHLVLAEVLQARGVIEGLDRAPMAVRTRDGSLREVELRVVPRGGAVEWARLGEDAETPLSLRHPGRKFWFTLLEETGTLYLRFNEVNDTEEESLREFAARLGDFIAANPVEQLVVDIRDNRGGDQSRAKPLVHAILCSKVNETGRLFVLIGRATFSAAMKFALWLEEHTHVLYAGEATGASPNSYGDSRKILLPNTHLTIRASTRYYQYDPTEVRPWLPPHIPVETTVEDVAAGRDPVLGAILDLARARSAPAGDPRGRWNGYTTPGLNWFEMALEVRGSEKELEVRADAPELEMQGAEAREVSLQGRRLSFVVAGEGGDITMRGRLDGDWLIGEAEQRGRFFPFVLRRAGRSTSDLRETPGGRRSISRDELTEARLEGGAGDTPATGGESACAGQGSGTLLREAVASPTARGPRSSQGEGSAR